MANAGDADAGNTRAEAATPIADGELPALFDGLIDGPIESTAEGISHKLADRMADRTAGGKAAVPVLLLAVSGGADSMALMVLIARWRGQRAAAGRPVPRIVTATVDHGLRAEAAEEARFVARHAARLGFAHHTPAWRGDKPATGIQEAARLARYGLLRDLARALARENDGVREHGGAGEHGRGCGIVTAHTEDDLAETFLMRLGRGSGIDGLAGMMSLRGSGAVTGDVPLHRPLLATAKARLLATLRRDGTPWVEDPSNDDPFFERVRVRQAAPMLAALGLDNAQIARSVRRLTRAQAALEQQAAAVHGHIVDEHGGAYASIRRDALLGQTMPDIQIRVLQACLASFGGRGRAPDLSDVEALQLRLGDDGFRGQTVAGCMIERDGDEILVFREPGRHGLPSMPLPPGGTVEWDRRFRVASRAPADSAAAEVRALGSDGGRLVAELGVRPGMPRAAVLTLPSVWCGARLLAVPNLAAGLPHRAAGALDPRAADGAPVYTVERLARERGAGC